MNARKDGRMTRLRVAARYKGVPLEVFVQQPDRVLMRIPNLGRKTIALAKTLRGASALSFWAAE